MTRRPSEAAVGEPRWLLTPSWLWIVAFFVAPLCVMVAYAFAVNDPDRFFTVQFGFYTDQFAKLLDPIYLAIYRDTFVMAFLGTAICLLIGYPFAYFLATRVRNKTMMFLLVIVPFWTSLLIRTYSWILILGEQGLLSDALQATTLRDTPMDILYTPSAVLIGVVYDYLPLMIFPLFVSIERMDHALIEAGRDLGSTGWQTFRRVTLPMTMPGVVAGCLLTFIPMMGEYVVPAILGGAKSFLVGSLIANEILTAVNWPFGAAIAVGLILVMLLLVFFALRMLGRRAEEGLGAAF